MTARIRTISSSRPQATLGSPEPVWTAEAFEFLAELHEHNDREWFKANRERYDALLVAPAEQLADSLADLGDPHFFRPYRDARFNRGAPIREEVGVAIMPAGGAAYYFQLSSGGLMLGAGIHRAQPDQLTRFRDAIVDDRRADGFDKAIAPAIGLGFLTTEPELKRLPRGYPSDHPRSDWLRMKSLTVNRRHERDDWLHTLDCDATVRTELEATEPLVRWLAETVGPAARTHRP